MKNIAGILLLTALCAQAEPPKVSDCFKVNALLKMDEDHYWANWSNACPYTIDSVYVIVGFIDKFRRTVGSGVWGLHYITPGVRRIIRFTTPPNVLDYEFVSVQKITTEFEEALRPPPTDVSRRR